MTMQAFADQQIGAFLDSAASTAPSPGAGSSGAVALALGLACARKAIALTLHHADDEQLALLAGHLEGLTAQALAGGEADARCYADYIAAIRCPSDDPKRGPASQDALRALVDVGANLIAIGDEARSKLLEAKADVRPTMINDIAAALALIAAARSIHSACVAENGRAISP